LEEQDDFLKVKETLTRIGVSSRKEKVLYQSCHILHKQGKYYIVHFKEMFSLDGKDRICETSLGRYLDFDVCRRFSYQCHVFTLGKRQMSSKNVTRLG